MNEINTRKGPTQITLNVDEDIRANFKIACGMNRKTMTEEITTFMEKYIQENGSAEKTA